MRDVILVAFLLASLPYIFKRPIVGTMMYAIFSLMSPHRLTFGFAFGFPFAAILSGATLASVAMSREPKKLPFTPLVMGWLAFIAWTTFTALFALNPANVWDTWNTVMKTMLMVLMAIVTMRTVNDVKALLLTVTLSLGFWGFKGGIWTILSGGHNGMLGPASTYIGDNNTLALAMVTSVPLIVALSAIMPTKWTRRGAIILATLTAISAVGSYSRGALLGGAAMAGFLWLKSESKGKTGVLLLIAIPVLLAVMPAEWMGRMHSIDNYQEDASAQGRINAWGFAFNLANHVPLGGGFATFTPQLFQIYAPNPNIFFVAHSIYFQVLGEHGYFGLFLYLMLFLLAWRTGTRVIKKCGKNPELAWAVTTARMCQVSIIGYMTAGAFLAMAYYDLIYYVFAILVGLEKVLFLLPQPDNTPPLRLAFLDRLLYGKPKRPARMAARAGGQAPAKDLR